MCTVTWVREPDGYDVFFNRDEQRSRPAATAPDVQVENGFSRLVPIDPVGGGTWMGVNESGLTACLLNRYAEAGPVTAPLSRGRIVMTMLATESAFAAGARIEAEPLDRYRGFIALAFSRGLPVRGWTWDGLQLVAAEFPESDLPLTTSGYRSEAVLTRRAEAYRRMTNGTYNPDLARAFHASHDADSPFGVCMHRDDAETVSFSHVKVSPDEVAFSYLPNSPCRAAETEAVVRRL